MHHRAWIVPFRRLSVPFPLGRVSRRPWLGPETKSYSTEPFRQPKALKREIRTLRPDRLSSVDQLLMDISHRKYGYFTVRPQMLGEPRLYIKNSYNGDNGVATQPFPAGTRGVFYFHHMRGDDIQSQIRFRLCESIADFPNGHDLQRPDGSMWHITLRAMARAPDGAYAQVLALLRAEFSIDVDPSLAARRVISTLDPSKLPSSSQAVTDISGLWPSLCFNSGVLKATYRPTSAEPPFPDNTVGVFYYKQSRTAPTRLGELRFRLCRDVRHFAQGEDLCLPSGLPWCISSPNIFAAQNYQHLRAHLIKEGLLAETMYPGVSPNLQSRTVMPLRSLSDPFVVDLSGAASHLLILPDADASPPFIMRVTPTFRATSCTTEVLFTGRAIARLEEHPNPPVRRSTNLNSSTTGPYFALRILEFLTPVKRVSAVTRVELPQEGQLVQVMGRRGNQMYRPRHFPAFPVPLRPAIAAWVARTQGKVSDQ